MFATSIDSAKPMLRYHNPGQINYALRLPRHELRMLVRLLTGHADLNRHLTLISVKSDALCPLCQEEEESSLHFLGKYSATMRIRFELLDSYLMDYGDLGNLKYSSLLKFTNTSKRLC